MAAGRDLHAWEESLPARFRRPLDPNLEPAVEDRLRRLAGTQGTTI